MNKRGLKFWIVPALLIAAASIFTAATVFAITAPANFQTNAVSACQIQATWTKVAGADHYLLESSPNTSLTPATFYTVSSGNPRLSTVTYNVASLAPNTHLYFQVAAVDANGSYSTYSPTTDAATGPTPATSTPKFTAASGQYGNKQIRIDFATTTPLSQYGGWDIQYRTSTDGANFGSWQIISGQVTAWNGTYYIDNGNGAYLNPSLVYEYQIRNYNSDLGCSINWYSAYSNPVIVPTVPTGLSAKYTYDINASAPNQIALAWSASKGADHYEVWRDSGNGYAVIASTTANSYTDSNIQTSRQYSYKVRAYNSADQDTNGYSDYSSPVNVSTGGAPQNFTANVFRVYQNNNGNTVADIAFTWSNTYPIDPSNGQPGSNYYVFQAPGMNATTGFTQIGGAPPAPTSVTTISTSTTVAAGSGKSYTFCVTAKSGTVSTPCSTPVSIDTNLMPLTNYAWTGYGANGGGGTVGIGAISFSSKNEAGVTAPYGVFMNNTTGVLSGYAWAGASPDYGWLSFNASDSSHPAAQVNLATGQVSGWAKFIGASSSLGAWDGWVSLSGNNGLPNRSPNYVSWSVAYSSSTGNFSGEAWGGDVAGWISWCDIAPFASGANRYCVTTGNAATGVNAPTIIATSTGIDSSGKAWIKVIWNNPISYKHVQAEISFPGQQNMNDKSTYQAPSNQYFSDSAHVGITNNASTTFYDLKPATNYGIFVRGSTQ